MCSTLFKLEVLKLYDGLHHMHTTGTRTAYRIRYAIPSMMLRRFHDKLGTIDLQLGFISVYLEDIQIQSGNKS
jgi:hypothetical protein